MSAESKDLLQRLKATVGQETVFIAPEELGRAALRMYAQAVQDPNPLYTDGEFARGVGLGDVMAPPTLVCDTFQFFGADVDEVGHPLALKQESIGTPLRAGNDYEFFQPIHPSDVITLRRRVKDVWEKTGRSGPLVFQQIEVTYHNQRAELLARNTELLYYRPPQTRDGEKNPQ